MNFLRQIIVEKKKEIALSKENIPIDILKGNLPGIKNNFKKSLLAKKFNIIAEIKEASPSKGIIVKNFNPIKIARIYKELRVSAISVLTEKKFFKGDIKYLGLVKRISGRPILRKDFIFDTYQIYESAFFSADAILLIARILSADKLREFLRIAKTIRLDCLVEVHNRGDLTKAIKAGAKIIGINNRDLATFKTDLSITKNLIKFIPKNKIIISESGVRSREDLLFLKNLGVNAVLVGEAFLKASSFKQIKKIING